MGLRSGLDTLLKRTYQWLLDCGIISSVITPAGSANVAFFTTLMDATEMVLSCDSRVLDILAFFDI